MNKTLLTVLLCAATVASAVADAVTTSIDTNATAKVNAIIGETLKVIEAEGWTPADVADAVKSLRGLDLRDTSTASGRERWHGKVVGMPVTDVARGVKITRYEDGTVFEDPLNTPPTPKVTVTTKGIPAALARSRERRASEITNAPVEVVTHITAGEAR
ncbi:MAG: hypothetical protein IJG13_06120 [Kiritimatiellae bacterium]|nr:hypothetical protein [Kiritimatiellia bacterium]